MPTNIALKKMDSDQIPASTDQNSPRLSPRSVQNPASFGSKKTPFKAPSTNPEPKNSFLHLWELESKYLCALIGTCATIPEIRRLAHKSRIDNPDQYTDYHLHNIFVNAAHDGTRPGRLLEKLFRQKFKTSITRFKETHYSQYETLWESALQGGDLTGSYYVLITNKNTPSETRSKAVGDIHMLSHISGMACRADLRDLPRLRKDNQRLIREIEHLNVKRTELIRSWEQKESELQKVLLNLKSQLRQQNCCKTQSAIDDQNNLIKIRKKNELLAQLVGELRREKSQLRQEILQVKADHQKPEIEINSKKSPSIDTVCGHERETQNESTNEDKNLSSTTDLNGKKVLYFGGRFRQAPHFRDLVEKLNGCLFFHDGGREDGDRRLDELLPQADVVVCPIDCISHSAIGRIKRECQKLNIRFLPVRRASLSTLGRALSHAYP